MMFIEILAAIVVGVSLGIFTGVVPGVHINLVAAVILSLSPLLLKYFTPISLAAAIMAMSITHVFVDFIPSIFLGAPSDATALAVLPGHKLLLEGRGYEAVVLSATGGFFGLNLVILLLPLLLVVVRHVFSAVKPYIGIILAGIVFYNVLREKGMQMKLWSFAIFLSAGMLGVLTLGIPNLNQPLLPLLAGLFGISTLLASALRNTAVPIQVSEVKAIKKSEAVKSVAAGAFSGGLMGIFPALGPAQAAMLARNLIGKAGKRAYLVTLGAVSTSSMLFGLITLFAIDKARNGSIAMMSEIVNVDGMVFVLLIAVAILAGAAALMLTSVIGKTFARNIHKIDYKRISFAIMLFVAALTFYFSQLTGLLILLTGTAIGLFTITKSIARYNLMGCLMLPVIIYYF
ncbi:tripartite tricarboxylate transporter permease [Candidatus Woesearchaeota archaeon]|nr:tripartite tricarboxylate transporter permease [Candidatus Woesearchaeota archaeon]